MLRNLLSRFLGGGGAARGRRGTSGAHGGTGSTGARIGRMVERFIRGRR